MDLYVPASALALFVIGISWRGESTADLFAKYAFIALALWGVTVWIRSNITG